MRFAAVCTVQFIVSTEIFTQIRGQSAMLFWPVVIATIFGVYALAAYEARTMDCRARARRA